MERITMKITLFSENGLKGKVPSNFPNMRTEFAWMYALDMEHIPLFDESELVKTRDIDLGIIILPKTNIGVLMKYPHFIENIKNSCKKIAIMQEGPSWFFQDLPLQEQLWFFEQLNDSDFILAHNDRDKEYYEGLLEKSVYINPTLMIEDSIPKNIDLERNGVIIGGNLVRWYGGFNSLMVAQEFEESIYAPTMGRMHPSEKLLDIKHLPYMDWITWIQQLNYYKYAVHLIPNELAGTFSLNCAYLGIPCIGNIHSNTQRICFPDLSVEPHDIHKAKMLARALKSDEVFYKDMSDIAKGLYRENFGIDTYIKKWKDIIKTENL
jgi:hypothetical protein